MKKLIFLALAFVLIFSAVGEASAVNFPKRLGYVNDYAALISVQDKTALENMLVDYEKQTSNEINVLIVGDFQGLDPFTFSQEVFNAWKLGKAGKNNGILFLIGPKQGFAFPERGEAFINVGAGLEGALPDSLTGTILRSEVFPQFKDKNVALGITNGITAIMKAIKGEYTPTPLPADQSNQGNVLFVIGFFAVFIIVAIILNKFFPRKGKGGSSSGGSSFFSSGSGGSSSSSSGGGGMSRGGGAGGSW